LERICQTVQPEGQNFGTFGHDIRNLLILACTEVESQWRGVLVANGVIKDHFCTADYIKLRDPWKLQEYSVTFPSYPWLDAFRPFANWNRKAPSQSLAWYDAYNAVKHNREAKFKQGTLANLFNAISACVVMAVAQFGVPATLGPDLQSFFHLSSRPDWLLSEVYIERGNWTPVQFDF
jgi:hypothetical protein